MSNKELSTASKEKVSPCVSESTQGLAAVVHSGLRTVLPFRFPSVENARP